MIKEKSVGSGEVFLIFGGGRYYSELAAKFCRTEKDVKDLIASDYNKKILDSLRESGHAAALEFDDFIFGVQGYARVTEVQLVRKRMASYMIKSGRVNERGKRTLDVVIPEDIKGLRANSTLNPSRIYIKGDTSTGISETPLSSFLPIITKQMGFIGDPTVYMNYDYRLLLELTDVWYNTGVERNIPEEDLRYMRQQAVEFKAAIKMNAHALRDWARIRMCKRAQFEIRDLCTKMVNLAKEAAPDLMEGAGPNCVCQGYCSELEQAEECKGKIPTKTQLLGYAKEHMNEILSR